MDNDALPTLGPGVDFTKMAPLNHRRSVSFMNHFITNTANFLNKFSNMAEEKLAQQSLDMQRIEIALNILEAKLASIPGLDNVNLPNTVVTPQQTNETHATTGTTEEVQPSQGIVPESTPVVDCNVVTVKNDIRYNKYLKMMNVGVPKQAIANKMMMEGLDPDLLDTPDAPVPDGGVVEEESDNESQSLSSDDNFSD